VSSEEDRRRRRPLFTTNTELNVIAAPALSGLQTEGSQRNRA